MVWFIWNVCSSEGQVWVVLAHARGTLNWSTYSASIISPVLGPSFQLLCISSARASFSGSILFYCTGSSLSLCVSNRKTGMAKSKSFSSVASSIWNKLPGHLSSISTLPASRKRLEHHLFSSAFPGNPSPSTGITFCDVGPSTNATQVRHTPPPG